MDIRSPDFNFHYFIGVLLHDLFRAEVAACLKDIRKEMTSYKDWIPSFSIVGWNTDFPTLLGIEVLYKLIYMLWLDLWHIR